jgi:hypothetical protein
MDWFNEIPAVIKDGRFILVPENNEPESVEDVTPAFKKAAEDMIANKFSEVLD